MASIEKNRTSAVRVEQKLITPKTELDVLRLPPLEIIKRGLEIERDEIIPLDAVIDDIALIDDFHAQELASSMNSKRKQITPIAARARLAEKTEIIVYDVLDGFHRTKGKKLNRDKDIKATVVYGCSDEEMFDLRILAASSVRSVQFPRLIRWVTMSFEATPYAEKGLSVTQAFALTANNTQTDREGRFSKQEISEIKDWVHQKCRLWGRSLGSTLAILRVGRDSDPELVQQVRTSGGGKDRHGRITPARLQTVVETFPGEVNYPAQRALLKVIVDRRLSAEESKQLATELDGSIKRNMTEEKIYAKADALAENLPALPPQGEIYNSRESAVREMSRDELIEKVEELEAEKAKLLWWRDSKRVNKAEKELAESILVEGKSIEAFAKEKKITINNTVNLFRSALAKRKN